MKREVYIVNVGNISSGTNRASSLLPCKVVFTSVVFIHKCHVASFFSISLGALIYASRVCELTWNREGAGRRWICSIQRIQTFVNMLWNGFVWNLILVPHWHQQVENQVFQLACLFIYKKTIYRFSFKKQKQFAFFKALGNRIRRKSIKARRLMIYLNILGNLSKAGLKISHLGKPSKIEKSFTSVQVCEPYDNNMKICVWVSSSCVFCTCG